MSDAARARLKRDAVIYAAHLGRAPAESIADAFGLSRRTVELVIKAGKSGHLAERLAQVCAAEKSSAPAPHSLRRPHRVRKAARSRDL